MDLNAINPDSVSAYLVEKIPEISFFLSTVLMFFGSDYMMETFLKKGMKKVNFITRTIIFLLYGLLALPALCTACAIFLQNSVLYPCRGWILPVLVAFFLLFGILLNVKYNMKPRL